MQMKEMHVLVYFGKKKAYISISQVKEVLLPVDTVHSEMKRRSARTTVQHRNRNRTTIATVQVWLNTVISTSLVECSHRSGHKNCNL